MKTFKTMENEFILIISNEKDITTDLVIKRLHERNIGFRRFNTEYFPTNIKSSIHISDSKGGIQLTTEKWTLSENEIKISELSENRFNALAAHSRSQDAAYVSR